MSESQQETNNVDLQPEPMPTVTKKDPRRVEQGKRLAMISKQAKERKMREKLKNEAKQSYMSYATTYVIPMVAFVSTSGVIYLWLTRSKQQQRQPERQPSPLPERQPERPKKKFENLG